MSDRTVSFLFKAQPLKEGYNFIAGPKNTELKLLEFGRICLPKSASYHGKSGDMEEAITLLNGQCSIEINCPRRASVHYKNIGVRKDVFSGNPTLVYIPRNTKYGIAAESTLHIAVFRSPSRKDTDPFLIEPDNCEVRIFGLGNWRRKACISLGDNQGADRLLVGETFNPPGNWSSYPPHKHDTVDPPREEPSEEIYFFSLKPCQGFGIQRLYTNGDCDRPLNEVYIVEDGDTVAISRGYHPVVAGAGYQLYYLWALAGDQRRFGAWSDDPRHAWVKKLES